MQTNNPSPSLAPVEAQAPVKYWITLYHYHPNLFILCKHRHPSFNEAKECLISTNRCSPDSLVAEVREETLVVEKEVIAFDVLGRKIQSTYFHWRRYDEPFDVLGHLHMATTLSLEECRAKVDAEAKEEKERRAKLKLERKLEKERKLAKSKAKAGVGATPPSPVLEAPEKQTEVSLGETLTDIEQSDSCIIENVTDQKCKKCQSPIIFCCNSLGKLEGKTILLGYDRCPRCGVLPVSKKQQQLYEKLSTKLTNVRKFRANVKDLVNSATGASGATPTTT